MTGCLCCRSIS